MKNTFHRQNHIERLIRKRQNTRIALLKAEKIAWIGFYLFLRPEQLARVNIQSDKPHPEKIFIKAGYRAAKTAADIQNTSIIARPGCFINLFRKFLRRSRKIPWRNHSSERVRSIALMHMTSKGQFQLGIAAFQLLQQ